MEDIDFKPYFDWEIDKFGFRRLFRQNVYGPIPYSYYRENIRALELFIVKNKLKMSHKRREYQIKDSNKWIDSFTHDNPNPGVRYEALFSFAYRTIDEGAEAPKEIICIGL